MAQLLRRVERRREVRRRIHLKAQMRAGCGWGHASIVDVSPRGLQIDTTRAAVRGRAVEIWHGEQVIVARVVWRRGTRAGLRREQLVPVDELTRLSATSGRPLRRIMSYLAAWIRRKCRF